MGEEGSEKQIRLSVLLMFLLGLFLAGFIFAMVGSNQRLFDRKYSLYMFQENVNGLLPGAFVTLSGLKVGVVGDIAFTEHNGKQGIRVELKIDRDYASRITSSSRAQIKTMGVLGDKFVDITLGKVGEPPLAEGSFIPSVSQPNMDVLLAEAGEVIHRLRDISENIQKITRNLVSGNQTFDEILLGKNQHKKLQQTLQHFHNISKKLDSGKGSMGRLIADTTLFHQLHHAVAQINQVLATLTDGNGTFRKILTDSSLYLHLVSLSQRSDTLLQRLNSDGTAGRVLQDSSLYVRLLKLSRAFEELARDLKQHPGRYVTFKLF